MHPLLAALPIMLLIAAMTLRAPRLRLPLPAHLALPGAALIALALQAAAGPDTGGRIITARIIEGVLTSLMPLAIVFGAVLLFRTLTVSGAMNTIARRLERDVPDPVIRVVLIAWAFSYLVEGLSGFGTPAAIAAPLLVGLGFPPIRAAAACLAMNSVPVVFGAVGMPMWFGLGEIGLTSEQLRSTAVSAAIVQCAAAPVVVALALRMLFPWHELKARAGRILIVVAATVAPSTVTALFSLEFPTIVGGASGLAAAFAVGRFGRATATPNVPSDHAAPPAMPLWRAAFPLAATVALLAVTRIEPLGLRGALNATSPAVDIPLGSLGELSISAALVVKLHGILGTDISWNMAMLYVPFIIPFVVVALASAPMLGMNGRGTVAVWTDAVRRLALPAAALAGAMVFVKLMMHGGSGAPVVAIGRAMADGVAAVHGPLWLGAGPLVGALGSFFSGSATVSNLTFAPVQAEIAERLGLDGPRVLALQAVGGAMGNMVCIHNIVAVAAVLGLTGERMRRVPPAPVADAASGNPPAETDNERDPIAQILRLNALPLAAFALVAAITAAAIALVSDPASAETSGTTPPSQAEPGEPAEPGER